MSRWFRFYDDAINDAKVLKLSDKSFRLWVGLLCLASKNGGVLPLFEDMALLLRMKKERLQPELEVLIAAGLIDHNDDGMSPHNWSGRQYKSDVSTDRVKSYRNKKRNVSETELKRFIDVSETPPDTEQKQIQKTEQKVGTPACADEPNNFVFEGQIIRLKKSDYDRWRQSYPAITDFDAVLHVADAYYGEHPPKDGKWFFPVSRWLQKEHSQALERRQIANARPDLSW